MKFGPACSLTMGHVGTDGMATMCEPIVAISMAMLKSKAGNMPGMYSDCSTRWVAPSFVLAGEWAADVGKN